MIVRSDIFNNTYSGSACRKVPDIVVPIGRLSILEHFDWISQSKIETHFSRVFDRSGNGGL